MGGVKREYHDHLAILQGATCMGSHGKVLSDRERKEAALLIESRRDDSDSDRRDTRRPFLFVPVEHSG